MNQTHTSAKLAAVLLCFFLSGAAGLIYQVAWGKALGLVFGHTVYAVATVIAVFMGGLALGSAWLGRWSEHRANPVALYAWIELIIAATGALSLVGLAGVRWLYLSTYHAVEGSTVALLALRFAASALVLFVPTFLMGGTLPILVRGLTRSSAELGTRISRLYWVNTAGAVGGTLAAGFLLLPRLGLRGTVAIAVGLNVAAGVVALALSRGARVSAETPEARPPEAGDAPPWFLLGSFAFVGATAIAYEVAWTRLLATTLGSSTYAFTLMLATFLAGIVLGSFLFDLFFARSRDATLGAFALTQTLTGLAAFGFLVFYQQLPQVVPPILQATKESFGGLVLAQFVTCTLAMLPAAVIFGFNFPLVTVLIAGRPGTSGRYAAAVGRAYAANTLGAIAGAMAAGFWLVPRLGSFRVVGFVAATNFLLAVLLQLRRRAAAGSGLPDQASQPAGLPFEGLLPPRRAESPGRRALALALNCVLLGAAATAAWRNTFYDPQLANFGTVLYWDLYEDKLSLSEAAATVDIVFAEDGMNSTITVARTEDYLSLRTNGKVDASNHDLLTQLMLGHLGPVFHPAPRRVLVIGFGSGMTVSALSYYPEVERVDCVEIEPAVLRAAPHLEPLNRGVLRDPRVRVILDDGRNFLLTTRERYDLIISEPSNPWIAGVATLFTDEFYREVKARLAPGGILVQWIQAYSLYPQDLRMVLGTLAPHFPQVSMWRGEEQDILLLAQAEPRPLTLDRLRRLWNDPRLRRDYETLGMRRPEGLAAFHLLDDTDLRRLVGDALRNTDDHTRLEYRAPLALLAKDAGDKNVELVMQHRSRARPATLASEHGDALLLGAAETLVKLEEFSAATYFLSELPSPGSAEAELVRGRWLLARGEFDNAEAAYRRALQLEPDKVAPAHGLAEVARRRVQHDTAELLLRQVLARDPDYLPALESMALLERHRENWTAAVEWQRKRLAADPAARPEEFARLGEWLFRAGELREAAEILLEALRRDPYNYVAHRHLGEIYRLLQDLPRAVRHLDFVVRYFPTTDSGVYAVLADLYRSLGRLNDADAILRKGARLFPSDTELQRRTLIP